MNSAALSALSALSGSVIGAISSVATTWFAQVYQNRAQRISQRASQREHLFNEFIAMASKLYADALTHDAPDPLTLVPLYALKAQISLFAAQDTTDRAEEVMQQIVGTYYEPSKDFRNRRAVQHGEHDLLLNFTLACRAELTVEGWTHTVRRIRSRMNARP